MDFYDTLADFINPEYYLAKRNPEQWTAKYWKKTRTAEEVDGKKKKEKRERKKVMLDPENTYTTTKKQQQEGIPQEEARNKDNASDKVAFQKKRKLTNTELIPTNFTKKTKQTDVITDKNGETQKIIHSKFELVKPKKKSNNPLKALQKIQSEKAKLSKILEKEPEKADVLAHNQVWKSAIARAKGDKVKDNEAMLQQSVNKLKKEKAKRIEKWSERKQETNKGISDRAQKRQAALDKRIQQKKERRLSKGKPKSKDKGSKGKSKDKLKKKSAGVKKAGRPGFEGTTLKNFKK